MAHSNKSSATTQPRPAYVQGPLDACVERASRRNTEFVDTCSEAVGRLNVVIEMLRDHDCSSPNDLEDCQGYDLTMMEDALTAIRDMLHHTAHAPEVQ